MRKYTLTLLVMLVTASFAYAGEWFAVDGGSIELDLRQKEMEDHLWIFLDKQKEHNFHPREEYTYQYQANIKDGQQELYINAFCHDVEKEQLHKSFVVVFDGGSCYFQVKYNFEIRNFYDLSVNGEG